jgi:hypothetical protein
MKYIKEYRLFENVLFTNKKDIEKWLLSNNIKNYIINSDSTIDITIGLNLRNLGLSHIPVQFNCIYGSFLCDNNKFESFMGFPKKITKDITCINNNFKSFEGFPEVNGHVNIGRNPVSEIYNLFKKKNCIQWINEYKVIRNNSIVLENFKEVVYMMDIKNFDYDQLYELKNYKII